MMATHARGRKSIAQRRRLSRRGRLLLRVLVLLGGVLLLVYGCSALTGRPVPLFGHRVDTVKLQEMGIPDSLIALYERNSETKDFVLGYPNKAGEAPNRDLSGEVHAGEVPLLLQWDERWGYETYGDDFMAVTGCGPTCLSMVYCGLTGDGSWDPYRVACLSVEQGYYVSGSGSSWSMMSDLAWQLGLTVHTVPCSVEGVAGEISSGHPIICVVGPGDFTSTGHFLVLKELVGDDSVRVLDPNSKKRSARTWRIDTILDQTQQLWSYSLDW